MNKTFWIGFIVVYIVMLAINFLVHGVLMQAHYDALADVFRPEAEIMDMSWLMYVSSALYLYLFCKIFSKICEDKGAGEGVRFGLLLGLFFSIPMAIDQYVMYPITPAIAAIWFVSGVVSFVIAGVIFAAIYKPTRD